ncbi:hypothetical protein M9H77_12307 [Catharanthus roseus]|uniref:Uncharacterized protein n=1 Tax=Catharanthus roseus TaxID=4058 RepID=A0ACC0BH55_CATRO|nr:hypothetical protein M9H77_12307 [Catharanthus roseus]
MKVNTYLIVTRYLSSRTFDCQPYVHWVASVKVQINRECSPELTMKKKKFKHNHAIGVYTHGHTQAAKLTEEQLRQTEQFRKSHVPPRNILRFFQEQNVGCTVSAQKIYNVVAKIKKNRIQERNTIEEVLCLSTQRGYTVFYRNCEDNNVLSDIVVAHPTSIEMMRM